MDALCVFQAGSYHREIASDPCKMENIYVNLNHLTKQQQNRQGKKFFTKCQTHKHSLNPGKILDNWK